MKKYGLIVCLGLLFFVTSGAEMSQVIADGKILADKVRVRKQHQIFEQAEGVVFAKPDSVLLAFAPKTAESFTVYAEIIVQNLPVNKNAVIALRNGFHNLLGIDTKGHFIFTCWGNDRKTVRGLRSAAPVELGKPVLVAGVIDVQEKDMTVIRLYVNGEKVGETSMPMTPHDYSGELHIGSDSLLKNSAQETFVGVFKELGFINEALSAEKIAELK